MSSKASRIPGEKERLRKHSLNLKQLEALIRLRDTARPVLPTKFSGGSPAGATGGGTGNFLPTQGGTMIGNIAFDPKLIAVSDGRVDLDPGGNPPENSSYILVAGQGSPDDIRFIDGAERNGQFLIYQGTNQQVQNILNANLLSFTNIVGDGFTTVTVTLSNTGTLIDGDSINVVGTDNFDITGGIVASLVVDTSFTYQIAFSASTTPESSGLIQDGNIITADGNTLVLDGTVSTLNVPIVTLIFDITVGAGGTWRVVSSSVGTGGGSSPLTTKGDIFGFDTVDARIPVGTDGQVLTADSVEALGVKWAASAAGGMNTDLSNMISPTLPTVDLSMNGQSIDNILSLDVEDSAGATKLGISGPLGVGARFSFISGDDVFFTENITDRLKINADGLDVFAGDIIQVDRLQMSGGTTSATSVNDVVWYLDADGNLVSNVNATDGWIWSSGNIAKMILTDTTLEKRNVTAPTFQLYNTIAAQNGTAATINFLANSANTSTGVSMGFIIGDTEDFTTDGRGALKFGVNLDGTPTLFLTMNEGDDEQVDILQETDFNSQDVLNVNRLQMSGGTTSATSVNDVVWYLDAAGNLVSNINATDGWIWSSGNIVKMILTDSTLEKRNVTAPTFQLYNTNAAQNGTAATMSFLANSANTSTGVSMGFIIGDTEDFTGDGRGALKFGVNLDGTPTTFLTMNEGDDEQVDILQELDMNTNDISNTGTISFTTGTGSIIGASSPVGMTFNLASANTFLFVTGAEEILDITTAGLTMRGTNNIILGGNDITEVNQIAFNVTNQTITDDVNGLRYSIPDTLDTHNFIIDGNTPVSIEKFFLNLANTRIQMTEEIDPASPAAGDIFVYAKLDSGIAALFYKQSDSTVVGPLGAGGAAGANTALSNLASVAINTSLLPNADGTLNNGSATFAWNDVFQERVRIETGGSSTSAANQIIADGGGMIFNTPAGDRYEFNISGSPNGIAIEEDRIEFLTSGRQHRIDATGTSINILSENIGDSVEIWTGTGRTNVTIDINSTATTFFTQTSDVQAVLIQLIQNNNTPADFRTIGNIDFIAENSVSSNEIYARVSASSQDITSATEDGLLQLGVVSGGTLISGIDIEGSNSGGANDALIGFFGESPVVQQNPASDTLANLYTALRNLGLLV